MSLVAGIDYSTHAVDVVWLDEDTDRAEWWRRPLAGRDAFERTRELRRGLFLDAPLRLRDALERTIAIGIEEPRGYNAGALYRVQGAILACLPRSVLVQPWLPSVWRKAVGLPGNAPKRAVYDFVRARGYDFTMTDLRNHPADKRVYDPFDAYCIALATRNALQKEDAA